MANEYLTRTPTSTGNRKVFTWSGWVKKQQDAYEIISFSGPTTVSDGLVMFGWGTTTGLYLNFYSSSVSRVYEVDEDFRDFGSWLHYQISVDTTQVTEDDRINFYINGAQKSLSVASGYSAIPQNYLMDNMTAGKQTLLGTGRNSSGNFAGYAKLELSDIFFVDGQALTPDVFGFYKDGNGYISAGSIQATDFRPGQWVPKAPRVIKAQIERNGGFGVNGFYLPMNDSSNFGADFHTTPNSIITLKGEDLPQPRNGAPETTDAYVSQLREDPYADNLVLAVPGISGGQGSGYGDYSADIKGSGSNKTVTANGNAGVAVTSSYYGSALSFDGSGDYMEVIDNGDFSASGDFTVEFWGNLNSLASAQYFFAKWNSGANQREYLIEIATNGTVNFNWSTNGNTHGSVSSQSGLVSINQWNHYVWEKNNSTLSGYVNGVVVGIKTDLTLQYNNTSNPLYIGSLNSSTSSNVYIQDLRVYKGVAKYKGGFDVPRPYTPVGIATWRAVPDTTANNFATWNAVQNSMSLTDGNLTCTGTGANQEVYSTIGITTGKWYVEARTNVGTYNHFGVRANSSTTYGTDYRLIARDDGNVYGDTSEGLIGTLSDNYASAGDIVAMAIDGNLGQITYYVNGVNVGGPYSIYQYNSSSLPTPYKIYNLANSGDSLTINFGQNPSFSGQTTAGTNTDGNGKGLFKYQPPSGFLALCEDNLPTPAISDPGEHFKTVLYTGSQTPRSIQGLGFQPDLVWLKARSEVSSNALYDSVRGPTIGLFSNRTDAEETDTNNLTSFDDNGFSLGTGYSSTGVNGSGRTYVAWCWRAGAGTTSTNTDGSITSVVSVNQDAGFSIVSWTSDGTNLTVGHGLNKVPSFIIQKQRDATANWTVYHEDLAATEILELNTTNAKQTSSDFGNTRPTSSVLSSNTTGVSGRRIIAYCWTEIEGFSKAFSYVGNGNADGPMIWLGIKPAFVMIKRTDGTGNWVMHDNARNSTNPAKGYLLANSSGVEEAGNDILDLLSNGFKIRNSWTDINASGGTYIGMAFAESPFAYSNSK